MFDFTSSKLLILGIIALIVVGPKDLPLLLRTIGKYVGIVRRQAAEFRAQFEEALRESEFEQIKKDVEKIGHEAEQSMRDAEQGVSKEIETADREVQAALEPQPASAAGLPIEAVVEPETATALEPPSPAPPAVKLDDTTKPPVTSGA